MLKVGKRNKMALIALGLLAIAVATVLRGLYVWTSCGYDCAAFQSVNLSATAAMLLGTVLGIVGVVMLLVRLLEDGR